jgi:hypothetical protein
MTAGCFWFWVQPKSSQSRPTMTHLAKKFLTTSINKIVQSVARIAIAEQGLQEKAILTPTRPFQFSVIVG